MPGTSPTASPAVWGVTAVLLALAGCTQDPSVAPASGPAVPARGQSGGGKLSITVSAADPDTIPVDTTITVRILGSGFAPGATVEYLLAGTGTDRVRATEVRFVSSSELSTTTVVEREAALGSYDVAVMSGGKRGVGVEKVEVVVRLVLLTEPSGGVRSGANDVSDHRVVVGWMADAGDQFFAVKWTPANDGWVGGVIGQGSAIAVNSGGDILRRWHDGSRFHSFVRTSSGIEVYLGPGSYVNDLSDDGTIIGWAGESPRTPVYWLRTGAGTWSAPIPIPNLAPLRNEDPLKISPSGDWIGGFLRAPGARCQIGAVWKRDGGGFAGPLLMQPDQGGGGVMDVNDAGAAVGHLCDESTSLGFLGSFAWAAVGATPTPLIPEGATAARGMLSRPIALDATGRIAGTAVLPVSQGKRSAMETYAVYWPWAGAPPVILGTRRDATGAQPGAMNNRGLIAGSQGSHAAVWILP